MNYQKNALMCLPEIAYPVNNIYSVCFSIDNASDQKMTEELFQNALMFLLLMPLTLISQNQHLTCFIYAFYHEVVYF